MTGPLWGARVWGGLRTMSKNVCWVEEMHIQRGRRLQPHTSNQNSAFQQKTTTKHQTVRSTVTRNTNHDKREKRTKKRQSTMHCELQWQTICRSWDFAAGRVKRHAVFRQGHAFGLHHNWPSVPENPDAIPRKIVKKDGEKEEVQNNAVPPNRLCK